MSRRKLGYSATPIPRDDHGLLMDWLGRFTTETPQKLMVKTCKKHDFRSRFSENQSSDTKIDGKNHGFHWFPVDFPIDFSPPTPFLQRQESILEAVIKNADMAEDMQQDAIDSATQALEKYNIETLS